MKRVISLFLVLVLSVYLPCTAYAAVSSPDNTAPTGPAETGDPTSIGLCLLVMVIALIAIAVATVFYRKSLKNDAA